MHLVCWLLWSLSNLNAANAQVPSQALVHVVMVQLVDFFMHQTFAVVIIHVMLIAVIVEEVAGLLALQERALE